MSRAGRSAGAGRLLGAHVSTAGGVWRAPARADEIGARAMQIFTRQPQRWSHAPLTDEEVTSFRDALATSGVRLVASHDSYLINLATHDTRLFRKSAAAFRAELERCVRLGVHLLVTHPGFATAGDRPSALRRNAAAVAEALADVPGATAVLFETTAGSGTALGCRFEEIAALLDAVPEAERRRIGVCLDTCHVYAAGYDLREECEAVIDEFDSVVGLGRLRLLHLNDSVGALGSRRDRHAHIGHGMLGERAFAAMLRNRRIRSVPGVLETPKNGDAVMADRRNLAALRRLARGRPRGVEPARAFRPMR
ncbi:MAG: deoxyribonuclease IV [Gemmatimonadota bacterium]